MPCTVERQITVALEDRPGQLADICRILAERGVNICALSVIDNIEHGVVRLVTSDPDRCREALTNAGFFLVEADVLALDLRNEPGCLAHACEALGAARINIAYAYSSGGSGSGSAGRSEFIFKVSDLEGGQRVLGALLAN